ncbi:hypothetical protein [Clostridium perfringens]|uniref:hypothetical protein n=1 Tax=Clostridium perfringens TaxID=1502 RepID=UPI0039E8E888
MMKLISENIGKERTSKVYECLGYEIRELKYHDGGYVSLIISGCQSEKYLPSIYTEENFDTCDIEGFKIQTTAYGALHSDEIEEVIKGYQVALKVVKELEKKYL